jgi:NAD(P)-dependent dehydrogenase (short-subunit alcohol dehydrogenase family)
VSAVPTPSELFDLSGLRAVVIGGTGTLGGLFSLTLAAAGAHVVVMGRSRQRGTAVVEQIIGSGGSAEFGKVDLESVASIEKAASRVQDSGGLDILVNSFGANNSTPFTDLQASEWERLLQVNLSAVFHSCQKFRAALSRSSGSTSIINISSASSGPPLTGVLGYGVAKAGVNNLTQYLANELADAGIRVNALVPGFFPAEQNRALLTPERIDSIVAHTPLRRLGRPEELAGALLWLASPRASGYVTGSLIRVDGGFSAMTI